MFKWDDARNLLWYENTGKGQARDIQIDAKVADDCPPDRLDAQAIIGQWVKLCHGKTLGPGDQKPVGRYPAMLRYIEVAALTYTNELGRSYTFAGRAYDLRLVDPV